MISSTTKRWKQEKKPKPAFIAAAALAAAMLVLCAVFIVLQTQRPAAAPQLAGKGTLAVDYELAYKPNSLYDQPKPAEKEARLLAFVDRIRFRLAYALQGFDGLPADYEVSVVARLTARSSESSKYIDPDFIVWQKEYTLLKPEQVSSDGSAKALEREISVDVNEYAGFARSVYEQTQVRTVNELKLVFRVDAAVHGPVQDISDNSAVELVIPMLDNLLVITGEPTASKDLKMPAAEGRPRADWAPWMIASGALALLCALAAAVLAQSGKKPDRGELYARSLARIFKQHGERLVRMEKPLPYQNLATIPIDGVDEMVKIADEISQPVFYYKAEDAEEKKIEFYVFDSGRIYYMVLFGDMGAPEPLA